MINAEAIETLRANYPDACYEQLREAVDVAIETLKAQDAAGDAISRQAAIDIIEAGRLTKLIDAETAVNGLKELPSAQPEKQHGRVFQEIVVEYPSYNTYPEYKGKPYFSIKYTENGQEFIGYGTYKPEVLSEYLKEYFMPSTQPEIIRCKDCKEFRRWIDTDIEFCDRTENRVSENDFCSMAERRTDGYD